MAKDTYWFRHDSNAARDPKILEMRSIWGYEGYGLYWAIIEYLRDQPGYKYKVSKKYEYKPLSGALGADPDRLKNMIEDLVNEFDLLRLKGGFLYSESLINRMKNWEKNKANGAKGGRPKKTQIKPNPNPINNPNGTQTITGSKPLREEKRREEEIREEDSALARTQPPPNPAPLRSQPKTFEEICAFLRSSQIWLDQLKMKRPMVDVEHEIEIFAAHKIEKTENHQSVDQMKAGFFKWTGSGYAKQKDFTQGSRFSNNHDGPDIPGLSAE